MIIFNYIIIFNYLLIIIVALLVTCQCLYKRHEKLLSFFPRIRIFLRV